MVVPVMKDLGLGYDVRAGDLGEVVKKNKKLKE